MFFDQEKFRSEQKVVAKLFETSKNIDRLPQNILLFGEINAPLLQSAMYLAQSIECEENGLACNNCPSCQRFLDGTHPDFILLDGKKAMIKKGDIDALEQFYSLSNLEKGHKSTYVINCCENITTEAINALLKFLEEPQGQIYAILTTTNRDKVLPTILSRCEQVQIVSPDITKVLSSYRGEISQDKYYILSKLAYSEEEKIVLDQNESFTVGYNAAINYLEALYQTPLLASYVAFKDGNDTFKNSSKKASFETNKCYNYFYSVLEIIFSDTLRGETDSPFKEVVNGLQKYKKRLPRAVLFIDSMMNKLTANMNFTLQLARLMEIMEDTNNE